MPAEALSRCPGCGKDTKTVAGRCPQCGYVKNPGAVPYSETYVARGPGPDPGPFGVSLLATVPGLGIAALGLFVLDSLALGIVGVVVLVVGALLSIALGNDVY